MKRLSFGLLIMSVVLIGVVLSGCVSTPPDLSNVTSYYVRENGSDKNSGISEDKPFKTLAYAITRAAKTPVKTITVLGTLTTPVTVSGLESGDEILITGKPGEAALKPAETEGRALRVAGNLKVRMEGITVQSGGVMLENGAVLTLGMGMKVSGGDLIWAGGGGVAIIGGGTALVMEADSEISQSKANWGGGVYLENKASLIMKDNSAIKWNTAVKDSRGTAVGGGIVATAGSAVTMLNNAVVSNNHSEGEGGGIEIGGSTLSIQDRAAVSDNTAFSQGGGCYGMAGSVVVIQDNAVVSNNVAQLGMIGGIGVIDGSSLTIKDSASVLTNCARTHGGGIYIQGSTATISGNVIVSGNAAGIGGGINLQKGSTLTLQDSVAVKENTANISNGGMGGGLLINGSQATLEGDVSITDNSFEPADSPDGKGRDVYIGNGGTLNGGNRVGMDIYTER